MTLGKDGWQKYDEVTFSAVQMHFYRRPKKLGGLEKRVDKSENKSIGFYRLAVEESPAILPLFSFLGAAFAPSQVWQEVK